MEMFADKLSFCYGVFESSNLVANVGIKYLKLNDTNKSVIFQTFKHGIKKL